jgi:hypothetical protein
MCSTDVSEKQNIGTEKERLKAAGCKVRGQFMKAFTILYTTAGPVFRRIAP